MSAVLSDVMDRLWFNFVCVSVCRLTQITMTGTQVWSSIFARTLTDLMPSLAQTLTLMTKCFTPNNSKLKSNHNLVTILILNSLK